MKNKIIILTILVLAILGGGFWYSQNYSKTQNSQNKVVQHKKTKQELAQEWVKKGNFFFDEATAKTYNIEKADEAYHKALELDPNNERALFQATRVHYVQGEFDAADMYGEKYIKKFPNKKRIHYVLGLNDAYAKNFDKSIEHFKEFINSGESTNAGYLDLAWVYFQKGDYETAKKYLEEGIEKYGDNTWLNLSLAMNKFNLGEDKKEILALLDKAEKQANELTPEKWKISYSSNDPRGYENDIQKLKDIIQINRKIVKGESVNLDLAKLGKGLKIEALSPKGAAGGYTVSACCDAQYDKECESSRNSCGMYRKGRYNCSGVCKKTKISDDDVETPVDDYCDKYSTWEDIQPLKWEERTDCVILTHPDWSRDYTKCIVERDNVGKVKFTYYGTRVSTQKNETVHGTAKPKHVYVDNGGGVITVAHNPNPVIHDVKEDSSIASDQNVVDTNLPDCSEHEAKPLCSVFPNDPKCSSDCKSNPDPACQEGDWYPALNTICDDKTTSQIDDVCHHVKLNQHGTKHCADSWTDPHRPGDDDLTNGTVTQGNVGVTKEWSTDKVHWSDDFDHLILLKTKHKPIYIKIMPKSDQECKANDGTTWEFHFNATLNNWTPPVTKQMLNQEASEDDLLEVGKILTLMPTINVQADKLILQDLKVDYCPGAPGWNNPAEQNETIKFKIVNITQQET